MQLEAIKVFCDIASMRNFSRAAAANGLSQPAVSRIVHQLEDRLKGKLVDRSRRPLQLTPLGEAYYQGCKRLLEQYLELEASLLRAPPSLAVTVRVAAIYSVGLGDMGQYVERFEAQHPHVRVHVDYLHPAQVYAHIRDGEADFGLVSFPRPTRDLVVLPWRDEEMVIACAPGHRLAGRASISVRELDGERYVAFDKGLDIRRVVDGFLEEHRVSVEVVWEFDNIENIKKAIELGVGLALLPEPPLRQEVQAGTLHTVRLDSAALSRPIGIIYRGRTPPGGAARDFIDLLRGNDIALPADSPAGNGHPSHRTARRPRKRAIS